jgi:triosephosphate isomerase
MKKNVRKKSIPTNNELLKSPTGIKGFDEITEGGLPKNRNTLVSGNAGSGKTLLGIDFLIKGVTDYNEPGVLISFEETEDDVYKDVAAINMDLQGLVSRKKILFEHVVLERTMRVKMIVANWKMNMEYYQGIDLFKEVINRIGSDFKGQHEIIVCCPFIHLHALVELSKSHVNVSVGAQNIYQETSGAYTGEISASMVKSTGAQYIIIGHSERRKYFGETNELVAKKITLALKSFLNPIICIGETLQERNVKKQFEVIERQLTEGTFQLAEDEFSRLVIAYEPIWAIGSGLTATAAQAQEIHSFIRKKIAEKYSRAIADNITILYGGSCTSENANELFAEADIDGGLIGGASLKARDFVDIVLALG